MSLILYVSYPQSLRQSCQSLWLVAIPSVCLTHLLWDIPHCTYTLLINEHNTPAAIPMGSPFPSVTLVWVCGQMGYGPDLIMAIHTWGTYLPMLQPPNPQQVTNRDYIIYFYGVKHSTWTITKCAMPALSCLLSFYTIPISLIFFSKNFEFSSYNNGSTWWWQYRACVIGAVVLCTKMYITHHSYLVPYASHIFLFLESNLITRLSFLDMHACMYELSVFVVIIYKNLETLEVL